MFTGIVEEIGTVERIESGRESIGLIVRCEKVLEDARPGDSLSVNGVCLTASGLGERWFRADVMPETMRRTSLGSLKISQPVNLERALRLSDRLGGHLVNGHVDGTGVVTGLSRDDIAVILSVSVERDLVGWMVVKGSVAVDGVSLTIVHVGDRAFSVSLVPHTARTTTLGSKRVGDTVNVECDIIAKYVETLLGRRPAKGNLSVDFLKEHGFA